MSPYQLGARHWKGLKWEKSSLRVRMHFGAWDIWLRALSRDPGGQDIINHEQTVLCTPDGYQRPVMNNYMVIVKKQSVWVE